MPPPIQPFDSSSFLIKRFIKIVCTYTYIIGYMSYLFNIGFVRVILMWVWLWNWNSGGWVRAYDCNNELI